MIFETLEDEVLVVDALLLHDLQEILVDLIVIDRPQCTDLAGLPFTLSGLKNTYS